MSSIFIHFERDDVSNIFTSSILKFKYHSLLHVYSELVVGVKFRCNNSNKSVQFHTPLLIDKGNH